MDGVIFARSKVISMSHDIEYLDVCAHGVHLTLRQCGMDMSLSCDVIRPTWTITGPCDESCKQELMQLSPEAQAIVQKFLLGSESYAEKQEESEIVVLPPVPSGATIGDMMRAKACSRSTQ